MGTRLTRPLRLLTWLAILGPAWYIVLTAAFGASVLMGVGGPGTVSPGSAIRQPSRYV